MNAIEFNEKINAAQLVSEAEKELMEQKYEVEVLQEFEEFSNALTERSSVGSFKDFITNKMIELFGESRGHSTITLDFVEIQYDKLPRVPVLKRVEVKPKTRFHKAVYKNRVVEGEYPKVEIKYLPEKVLDGFILWARKELNVLIKHNYAYQVFPTGSAMHQIEATRL